MQLTMKRRLTLLDANKKNKLIEPQIKFCESACEEFELMADGIKSGEAASMVSGMAGEI